MAGPLEGLKVLDMTHYAVGPWACALLGQLGAEVIKVEPPEGDWISRQPPPYKNGITTTYIAMNLNKKCIALNLRDERVREAVNRLVEQSDILIENHRPGFMDRRGLGYDDVARLNPRLVYCSSSGYGARGPYKDMGSTDPYGQAVSGFASVNGPAGGPPEGLKQGSHIDLSTSVFIVAGVLAAVYRRELTGRGQRVDLSQMAAAMALTGPRAAEYFATGQNPEPMGSGVANAVPSRAFRASEGVYINVSALDEATWARLCQAIERPDLAGDRRFAGNAARVQHRAELEALLDEVFATQPSSHWLARLEQANVPCGAYLTYNQIRIHPQVRALDMLEPVDSPWGRITVGGIPWRFSKTPAAISPTPRPGENTADVLAGLPAPAAAD